MKNPDNKPLRIHVDNPHLSNLHQTDGMSKASRQILIAYGDVLAKLAIAESNLVSAGKSSGLTHLLAIVKELERVYGFEFRIMEKPNENNG